MGLQFDSDCCLAVSFDADPVLVIDDGGTDPFTGEAIGFPYPRIYWSNGVVTDGGHDVESWEQDPVAT